MRRDFHISRLILIRKWNFEQFHNTNYITFDKNGGGKDEWMSIENVNAIPETNPNGAPLTGAWFMIGMGMFAFPSVWNKSKKTIPLIG